MLISHQFNCVALIKQLLAVLVFCASMQAALNVNIEAVQQSVVFLYGADRSGDVDPKKELGTGFFVRIPLRSDPKHGYMVLVTARHILDPQWAKCSDPNPTTIYARLNKKGYVVGSSADGVVYVKFSLLENGKSSWQQSSEKGADAAVLLIESPTTVLADVESGTIPVTDFPTDQELHSIVIGDQIVSAGLVPGFPGRKRNYPFFKFGFVSSIPAEDIESRCNTPEANSVRGWFIAANLVHGNSGSPIFFVPPGGPGIMFGSSVRRTVLLGVQSSSLVLADIAVMTPSNYIFEILQKMQLSDADLRRGEPPGQK
jgi:hypothetical protein